MLELQRNLVALGLLTILGVAAGVSTWWVLQSRGAGTLRRVCFDDVTGLEEGADVLWEGYRVGRVRSIERALGERPESGRAHFDVVLELEPDRAQGLEDTGVKIVPSLFGRSAVHLTMEARPGADVEDGDGTQTGPACGGWREPSVEELIRKRAEGTGTILTATQGILERVNVDLAEGGRIDEILSRVAEVTARVGQSTDSVRTTTEAIRDAANGAEALTSEAREALEPAGTSIPVILGDVESLLRQTRASLDVVLSDLESSAENLRLLTRELREHPSMAVMGRREGDEEHRR